MKTNEKTLNLLKNLVIELNDLSKNIYDISSLFELDHTVKCYINDYIVTDYPFPESFDEFSLQFGSWNQVITDKLNKVFNKEGEKTFERNYDRIEFEPSNKDSYIKVLRRLIKNMKDHFNLIESYFRLLSLYEGEDYLINIIRRLYPFEKNFNDVTTDVLRWYHSVEFELTK